MSTEYSYETEGEDVRSGWRSVTGKPSVSKLIDALLDLPSHREFNKSELAELADVSRNSVGAHADLLVELGLIQQVDHANRYRVNPDSEVFRLATQLDAAARDRLRSDPE